MRAFFLGVGAAALLACGARSELGSIAVARTAGGRGGAGTGGSAAGTGGSAAGTGGSAAGTGGTMVGCAGMDGGVPCTGPAVFGPRIDYPVAAGPSSIVVLDLNGDCKPDVALAGYPNEIAVFINQGDGTFAAEVDYPTGLTPSSIAAADFNGDGKPDLCVANTFSNSVGIFINQGDGTFAAMIEVATGDQPVTVLGVDVDGDGKPDLVVSFGDGVEDGTVGVLLNQGDGIFGPEVDLPMVAGYAIAAADLNGDGHPDLVLSQISNVNALDDRVGILINQGDGTFALGPTYYSGNDPAAIVATDLNGDGKPDLAVANVGVNTLAVFIGHGDGTFAPKVLYSTGGQPGSVAALDVHGDGKPDLAVSNLATGNVSVFANNGDGTFAPRIDYPTGSGSSPAAIAAADLNGDGKPDLAVAEDDAQAALSVFLDVCQP